VNQIEPLLPGKGKGAHVRPLPEIPDFFVKLLNGSDMLDSLTKRLPVFTRLKDSQACSMNGPIVELLENWKSMLRALRSSWSLGLWLLSSTRT
jgi:hypothetical protein